MEQPTVIQVTTVPFAGGGEYLVRELVSRLPDYGFESRGIYFSTLNKPDKDLNRLSERETLLGFSSQRNPLIVLQLRKQFKQLLNTHENLMIHAHLSWPLYYVYLAARGLDIPIFYTEHTTGSRRRFLPLLNLLESSVMHRYDEIVCVSKAVENSLVNWLGDGNQPSIRVILNGARQFGFVDRPKPEKNRLKLLSVGSLTYPKGFDRFLEALLELKEIIGEYKIVGEGPERPKLQRMINKFGLEEKVRLTGWSDEVESHYRNADFLIMPSRREGMPLVAIEGMSTGLPVLASDVEGLKETLGEDSPGSVLIEDNRKDGWVKAVRQVNEELDNYNEMSVSASRQAGKFTLDAMVEKYAELYRKKGEEKIV